VKYLAYGSNSEFTDSDETYILLMKKPYSDKIILSSASRQTYFLKGRNCEAPNCHEKVRLHPELTEANRVLQASLGLKIKSSPFVATGTWFGSALLVPEHFILQ